MSGDAMTQRLRALGKEQSGAIALLCMAAILIIMMMGLVIFDSIEIANEKVHVQASADASAFSQSSVEARTMNMMAFTNVGKRINIAYVAAYDTIMGWLSWLAGAGWVLTVLCAVGAVFFPALAKLCQELAQISGAATCVYFKEDIGDRKLSLSPVIDGTFGPELRAFNNYQQFMADITPYWAWTEGVWRGIQNQAPITMGYPAPKGGDDINHSSRLPIKQPAGHSWDNLCEKANETPSIGDIVFGDSLDELTSQADKHFMFVDFLLKNGISMVSGGGDFSGGGDVDMGDIDPDGEDADECDDLEKRAEEDPEFEFESPVKCDDDDDDDCEEQNGKVRYKDENGDWVEEELNENCLPLDIGEMLDELDCSDISAAGAYGSVFLAGSLALLLDHSEFPDYISWAFPESFRDRCGKSSGSRNTQSPERYGSFVQDGAAWELDTSNWAMDSSTLIFGYRPNAARNRASRDKFSIGEEVNEGFLSSAAESSGVWALSRGEITWQGDDDTPPNLWESQWGARVRPVALEGEWAGYGGGGEQFTMWDALQEIEDEMFGALIVAHGADFLAVDGTSSLITRPYGVDDLSSFSGLESIYDEYQSTEQSFEPMDNDMMEGLVK